MGRSRSCRGTPLPNARSQPRTEREHGHLKHAESVPRSALAVANIRPTPDAQGVSEPVATHSQGSRHPTPYQGSPRAPSGRVDALRCGALKKCVLELGGSDPMVVLDSNDLETLVETAWGPRRTTPARHATRTNAHDRHGQIYDEFVDRPTAKARGTSSFAPMSSRAAAETLAGQVDDAVSKGATLHVGVYSARHPRRSTAGGADRGHEGHARLPRELFGPVAVVYKVALTTKPLTLANDTPYGSVDQFDI